MFVQIGSKDRDRWVLIRIGDCLYRLIVKKGGGGC